MKGLHRSDGATFVSFSVNPSNSGPPLRWIVLAILLVALALRVGFVLTMPDTPLYWDERHYDTWATVHQGFWSSLFGGGEGPSLGDAFRASRQKGELFVGMVGAIYALIGRHPRAIFYLQAVLDTLTCLLLFDQRHRPDCPRPRSAARPRRASGGSSGCSGRARAGRCRGSPAAGSRSASSARSARRAWRRSAGRSPARRR
jgi:hypothetical protein